MSRTKLGGGIEKLSLDELVIQYAVNKSELDSYKTICEEENKVIKDEMTRLGEDEHSAGGITIKKVTATKESMNEAKLLEALKKHGITAPIKTKEYVDIDALESYLYNNDPSAELASDIDQCRVITKVVKLIISNSRKKKEDNNG